jgi:L-aspartate semialdehyde sulfurtransferase
MKTYEEINKKIESKQAVVLSAEEVIDYVDKKGLAAAAKEVDVVTTATFGPMCSSGAFFNFGHSAPKIRMTEAWLDDVRVYTGIAAVDVYLGATELRQNDPANMYYPGEFRFGGGHIIEKLINGEEVQLFALSYGTDDYPRKEIRTYITMEDLNQAIMVNPRNCYQNYNVAINTSDKPIYTYLGQLKPNMQNLSYSSAGQLSPLLNDPTYRTIGIGTKVWLAGAQGHVYAEGTQHAPTCDRTEKGVPSEGAGTLALTADMKKMRPGFARGVSFTGYGVSLSLGVGIPIPILDEEMLRAAAVKDSDIRAQVIDYSHDYPQKTGKVLASVTYEELKSGVVRINGKEIESSSLSSYPKAREIAEILGDEIRRGEFTLVPPIAPLPREQSMKSLEIRGVTNGS